MASMWTSHRTYGSLTTTSPRTRIRGSASIIQALPRSSETTSLRTTTEFEWSSEVPHRFSTTTSSEMGSKLSSTSILEGSGTTSTRRGATFGQIIPVWIPVVATTKTSVRTRMESAIRSEEHTSELQSLRHLVCRLL